MSNRNKFIAVLAMFVLLLLLAGVGFAKGSGRGVDSIEELAGKTLGGTASRMPENSSKILFESVSGVKLGGYLSFETVDETLTALRTGRINAAWFTDVTADYLVAGNDDLKLLETPEKAEDRFFFGLALANNDGGNELKEKMDEAIAILKETGKLPELLAKYGEYKEGADLMREGDMMVNSSEVYADKKVVTIGVSGNVPPLDAVTADKDACGFCVEFMDELAAITGNRVRFVYVKPEMMFSQLMAGRIDAVFAYGSGRNTVDTGKKYVVTDGYAAMNRYKFLTLK